MDIIIENVDEIDNYLKTQEIMLLKFEDINEKSKYNEYIHTLNFKVVNITDKEIIDFYDINVLPTICVYKNKNLIDSIEGFYSKTEFTKKLLTIIEN